MNTYHVFIVVSEYYEVAVHHQASWTCHTLSTSRRAVWQSHHTVTVQLSSLNVRLLISDTNRDFSMHLGVFWKWSKSLVFPTQKKYIFTNYSFTCCVIALIPNRLTACIIFVLTFHHSPVLLTSLYSEPPSLTLLLNCDSVVNYEIFWYFVTPITGHQALFCFNHTSIIHKYSYNCIKSQK